MPEVLCTDFFVNCYADQRSLMAKDKVLDIFSVAIKDKKTIDAAIINGEKMPANIEGDMKSFSGEVSINNNEITIIKNVELKNGRGYVVKFSGINQGRNYVTGKYQAFDRITGKQIAFNEGYFFADIKHFLTKYTSN